MLKYSIAPSQLKKPIHWIGFGFGSGLLSPAPGTWGTLAGLGLFLLIASFDIPYLIYGFTIFSILVGNAICGITARDLNVHDHPGIVWDEIAGIFVTLALFPVHWHYWLPGFLLFRLFDIWKPYPIRWLDQHVDGGFGIMIDDIIAGIWASLSLFALIFLVELAQKHI
jgi:phosphatidylglycerophosphatase A